MEIPVINRISDINPSFIPQPLSFTKLTQLNDVLKYGALLLAILASFTTILNRIKLIILTLKSYFHKTQPIIDFSDDWSDISDDTCSISSISDDDEDDECNDDDPNTKDDEFSVLGSGGFRWRTTESTLIRRRRNFGDLWSELTNGRNVVNLWDNFGLFDYESGDEEGDDGDDDVRLSTTDCQFPSGLVLSAAVDDARKAALRVWDTRVGRGIPAILAEWRPQIGRIVGVSGFGGGEKVFLRGGCGGDVAVGDIRKLSSPLMNLSGEDVHSWRDAGESRW